MSIDLDRMPKSSRDWILPLLEQAWLEGADYMAAQEGIAPDRDANPYSKENQK